MGRNILGKRLLSIQYLVYCLSTVYCPSACILERLAKMKNCFSKTTLQSEHSLWFEFCRWDGPSEIWKGISRQCHLSLARLVDKQPTIDTSLGNCPICFLCLGTVFVGVKQLWGRGERSCSLSVDPEVKTQLHFLYVHYSSIEVKVRKKNLISIFSLQIHLINFEVPKPLY